MNKRIKKKRMKRIGGSYKNYRIFKKITKRIHKITKSSKYGFNELTFSKKRIIINSIIRDIQKIKPFDNDTERII